MILSKDGMERAKHLASEIVRINNEQEIERARQQRIKQRKEFERSMETLGKAVKNAYNSVHMGLIEPIAMIVKSIKKGFHQ